MKIISMRGLLVLLLLLPLLSSCRLFHKPKPVPQPARIPVHTRPNPEPPPPLEPPPPIATEMDPQVIAELPEPDQPVLPPPPQEKKLRPRPGPRTPIPAEPPAAPTPAAPAPQLRPMLTAAQKQDLERSVSERLARAQNTLSSIGARRLSGELEEMATQVRTFIRQAEEARTSDLLRANNLAERAVVIAAELAKRLR